MAEPVVRNAADEQQVKAAQVKEKIGRDRDVADLKKLLELEHGRRFIWRLLEQARVFHSIWEPSAKIHFNAGQQDFGHFIMAEVVAVNPNALVQMMLEAKADSEIDKKEK